jgi:uncharacterized membrane protein
MTITTDLSQKYGEEEFSRRPATSQFEALLTLAAGVALTGAGLWRRGWMGTALAGGGGYLLYCGVSDFRRPYQGSVRVAFTINKDAQEIYRFISDPENWNRFLHAIELRNVGGGELQLHIGRPAGIDFKSHIEVTDQKPGEYIAWASSEQMLEHRGVINLKKAAGDRGTEISVALEYKAPAGPIARSLAQLIGWHPEQVVRESLRRLKQLMEAGEIPTTEGQAVGSRGLSGAAKQLLYRERPTEHRPAESELAVPQAKMAGD